MRFVLLLFSGLIEKGNVGDTDTRDGYKIQKWFTVEEVTAELVPQEEVRSVAAAVPRTDWGRQRWQSWYERLRLRGISKEICMELSNDCYSGHTGQAVWAALLLWVLHYSAWLNIITQTQLVQYDIIIK